MPKQFVTSANAPTTGFTDMQKPPPIAQAIRFGNMLFISGMAPLDADLNVIGGDDVVAQVREGAHQRERAGGGPALHARDRRAARAGRWAGWSRAARRSPSTCAR